MKLVLTPANLLIIYSDDLQDNITLGAEVLEQFIDDLLQAQMVLEQKGVNTGRNVIFVEHKPFPALVRPAMLEDDDEEDYGGY
jgi:hypothetical protein